MVSSCRRREVMFVFILSLLLFVGFSQGIIVKKELYRCVQGNCSNNSFENVWVEQGEDILVKVSVYNNNTYPVSGFIWDSYPKNLTLYNDSFNFSFPIYYTISEEQKIYQIAGSLYQYVPVRLVGKVTVPKLVPFMDPNISKEYYYILVGFDGAGNYQFIDIQPNSSFNFTYMLHVNQTGVFYLGRAAFTTRLYGVVFNPEEYVGDFCELRNSTVYQPLTISAVGMNLTNVTIMIDPVTDRYGNSIPGIVVDTDTSFVQKIYDRTSTLIHLKINVSEDVPVGEYFTRLYVSSDEIYQSQPMYIKIIIHSLQNDDPTGFCYIPSDYKPPFAKSIPDSIIINTYKNVSLTKKVILENGGGSPGKFIYSLSCENSGVDVIAPISGSVTLDPGEKTSINITTDSQDNCTGYLDVVVQDLFNTTVQTYRSQVIQTILLEDSNAGLEIVNCTTFNPIPQEINVNLTRGVQPYFLCIHNKGKSETEIVTLNNFVVTSSPFVIKDVLFYDSKGERTDNLIISPGEYGKVLLYLDLSSKPQKLNISVYSLGARDSVVLNITYTEPLVTVSENSITLGCSSNITISNNGTVPVRMEYSVAGDLADYLDIRFSNLRKTTDLNIIEIPVGDWLVSYPGKNVVNYKDPTVGEFIRGYYMLPGDKITMQVSIDYFKYLYTSSTATNGSVVLNYGTGNISIPVTYDGSNCLPQKKDTVYSAYIAGEYSSDGATLISWTPHSFKEFIDRKDINKVYIYRYFSGSKLPVNLYINGINYGSIDAGSELNYIGICMTKGTINDCYKIAPPTQCGNGIIELGEQCDYIHYPNGCSQDKPTCTSSCECSDTVCVVNGVIDPGEVCDPLTSENIPIGYACDNNCNLVPVSCTHILNLTTTDPSATHTSLVGSMNVDVSARDSQIVITHGSNSQQISGDLHLIFNGTATVEYLGDIELDSLAENVSVNSSTANTSCDYVHISALGNNSIILKSTTMRLNITSGNLTIVGNQSVTVSGTNVTIEINGGIEALINGSLSLLSTGVGIVNITRICGDSTTKDTYSGTFIYNSTVNNSFVSYSTYATLVGNTYGLVVDNDTSEMLFDGQLFVHNPNTEITERAQNNITLLYCCEVLTEINTKETTTVNISGNYNTTVITENTQITIKNETETITVFGNITIISNSTKLCKITSDNVSIISYNDSVTYNNYTNDYGCDVNETTHCSNKIELRIRNATAVCSNGNVVVRINTNNTVYNLTGLVNITIQSTALMRMNGDVNISFVSKGEERVKLVCGGNEVSNVSYGIKTIMFNESSYINETYSVNNYQISGYVISYTNFSNGTYEFELGNTTSNFDSDIMSINLSGCYKTISTTCPYTCPLISVSPEQASFEVSLGGTASQTFTITNIGSISTSEIRLNLSGDETLVGMSELSSNTVSSLAPGETASVTLSINAPNNDTYRGEYLGLIDIYEDTCGTTSIPFQASVGNTTVIIIPYNTQNNETIENLSVSISSSTHRKAIPVGDINTINIIKKKYSKLLNNIILKTNAVYTVTNLEPGTHVVDVVDPSLRYLSTKRTFVLERGKNNVVLVPMTPGEILSLNVWVENCTDQQIDSGTCILARGERYNITINTTIQELRYYIRYGFEVTAHQYVVNETTGWVRYTISFKCVRDSCVIPPDINDGAWLLPSSSAWIVGDGGLPVSFIPGGGGGGEYTICGGVACSSYTVEVFYPKIEQVVYVDINITELYKTVWYEVEDEFTVTSTATTNIPGEHATLVAELKNNDPYRNILDACVSISSDIGINTSGFNCTGSFCINDQRTKCVDIIPPNSSVKFTWDFQAGYYAPLGDHYINVTAVGTYAGTGDVINKSASVKITIVRPEVLTLSATSGLQPGEKAAPGELVPITVSLTNNGQRPASDVYLSVDYQYNLAFDSPCTANIPSLLPGDRINVVCYARLLKIGDGVVIFRATSRYSDVITRVIIDGVEADVDLKLIPSTISFARLRPTEVISYPVKLLNPGNMAMDVQFRRITGPECDYLLNKYAGIPNCTAENPANWVNITPSQFTIYPGEMKNLTLVISIPSLDHLLNSGSCSLQQLYSSEGCWYYGIFEFFGRSHDTVTRVIGALSVGVGDDGKPVVKLFSIKRDSESKKRVINLDTRFGCGYSNNTTSCYFMADVGVNTSVKLMTMDGDTKMSVYVSDGIQATGKLMLKEYYGGTVNVTLGSNSNWITLSPTYIKLDPYATEIINFTVNVPVGTQPGKYVRTIYAMINDSVVSTVIVSIYVPEKLYYSPKSQYVGAGRVGSVIPFSIDFTNKYPIDITLNVPDTDLLAFNDNSITVPAGSTVKINGTITIPYAKSWSCGVAGTSLVVNTRQLPVYVEYCVLGIYGKLAFNPELSQLSLLMETPQGSTNNISVYLKTFNVNTTGIATLSLKPGGSNPVDSSWFENDTVQVLVSPGSVAQAMFKFTVPENAPSGNYFAVISGMIYLPEEQAYSKYMSLNTIYVTIHVPTKIKASPTDIGLTITDGDWYSAQNVIRVENWDISGDFVDIAVNAYGVGPNPLNSSWISFVYPQSISKYTNGTPGIGTVSVFFNVSDLTTPGLYEGIIRISGFVNGVYQYVDIPVKLQIVKKLNILDPRLYKKVDDGTTDSVVVKVFNRARHTVLTGVRIDSNVVWTQEAAYGNITLSSSSINIGARSTGYLYVSISVASGMPAGTYTSTAYIVDNAGRREPIQLTVFVPEKLKINGKYAPDRVVIELYNNESTTLNISVDVEDVVFGVVCFNGQPGTYITLSTYKGIVDKFVEIPEEYRFGVCRNVGSYVFKVNISIPYSEMPGEYKDYLVFRTSTGKEVLLPVTIKVLPSYSVKVDPSEVIAPHGENTVFNITIINNKADQISGYFEIGGTNPEWLNITTENFSIPGHGSVTYHITVSPPYLQKAGYYTFYIYAEAGQRFGKYFVIKVPVDINMTYDENITNITMYDLVPVSYKITVTDRNFPGDQVRIHINENPAYAQFICGSQSDYGEIILSFNNYNETKTCFLNLIYPDSYPEGVYNRELSIEDASGVLNIKVPINITIKSSINITPARVFTEAIPGNTTTYTLTIKNNAPYSLMLVPTVKPITSSPVNASWFNLDSVVVPANSTVSYPVSYVLPDGYFGVYYGKLRFVSDWGHVRYSQIIIKSAVDMVIDVC